MTARPRNAAGKIWGPFFRDTMTLEEVYRYGTQHFDFHRAQLTHE